MTEVRIKGLCVDYDSARVVKGVDLSIASGEFISLLGPSGCGKTTILMTLAGLVEASAGEIWIGDELVTAPARSIRTPPERRNVGMVFQSYAIWPHMTVAQNIGYPLRARRLPSVEIRQRVTAAVEMVGLERAIDRPATDLSGGQQQRVAIARSLIFNPKVLLLDEPLSNLDSKLRSKMGAELRRIQRDTGVTAVFVTHDQTEALSLSDRIVVLRDGIIEQVGTPEEVYDHSATAFVNWFIGKTSMLEARIKGLLPQRGDERWAEIEVAGGYLHRARLSAKVEQMGAPILLSVRPENIGVTAPPDKSPAIKARVISGEFIGDKRRYLIETAAGDVEFFADRRHRWPVGTEIAVSLAPETGIIFDRTTDLTDLAG